MANESMSLLRKLQAEARAIFHGDRIARHGEEKTPWWEKCGHFWVTVIRSFWRNRCPVRASALAYTTLLALIPLLAVGISISTSFLKSEAGKQQIEQLLNTFVGKIAPQLDLVAKSDKGILTENQRRLKNEMVAKYDSNKNGKMDQEERSGMSSEDLAKMQAAGVDEVGGRQKVVESIRAYISNVSSGTLGATAIVALVFIAISLLSNIEATVNDIWGVTQGRSWYARVVQYWALITLGPMLLVVAMGLNVGPYLESTKTIIEIAPNLGKFVYKFLPLLLLILAFAGFYQLMPNTKVNWRAALVGGIVGGCLWHLNNVFSVIYFGQVVRNSQIYGKLVILPIFLLGIYLSWLIVLFGAQVAYAYQNRRAYIQERQTENVNERGREFVALRLMTYLAQLFHRGEHPASSGQIADALCVPSQLIGKIIDPLLKIKLIVEVNPARAQDEKAYAPSRPLDQISYQDILDAIRAGQGQELETRDDYSRWLVRGKFDEILAAEQRVAGLITLQQLVENRGGTDKASASRLEQVRS